MLRINLLPTKAAQKRYTARHELMTIAGLQILVLLALVLFHGSVHSKVKAVEMRINTVKQEISQLKQDVVRVEDFKNKAETLEQKLKVITDLQKKRLGPAHMLDDLATILTEQRKVWLVKLEEKDGVMSMSGGAMEHENISDFQLALERRSKFFVKPTLGLVRVAKSGNLPFLEWTILCGTNYTGG